jgi:hypothetical protein
MLAKQLAPRESDINAVIGSASPEHATRYWLRAHADMMQHMLTDVFAYVVTFEHPPVCACLSVCLPACLSTCQADVYERLDALDSDTTEARAASILHGLGFDKEMQVGGGGRGGGLCVWGGGALEC